MRDPICGCEITAGDLREDLAKVDVALAGLPEASLQGDLGAQLRRALEGRRGWLRARLAQAERAEVAGG